MNREVLYRGKRIDNGNWVEGFIIKIHREERIFILPKELIKKGTLTMRGELPPNFLAIEVIPDSVSECLNLTAKHDIKIFEGDILVGRMSSEKYTVVWEDCQFKIKDRYGNIYVPKQEFLTHIEIEVIGNKWDNPELLKSA